MVAVVTNALFVVVMMKIPLHKKTSSSSPRAYGSDDPAFSRRGGDRLSPHSSGQAIISTDTTHVGQANERN